MNLKSFLCITASLLLCACESRTRDLPQYVDKEYIYLTDQGKQLSKQGRDWNEKCAENINSKDCIADQQVLITLWSEYIARALRYKAQGEDCRAQMRTKIIRFNVAIAHFNIICAGHDHTDEEDKDCLTEAGFVETLRGQLHQEMVACQDEK